MCHGDHVTNGTSVISVTPCTKVKISSSVKISPSNYAHRKKTIQEELQLFCVLGCILRSPVCDDDQCFIFKSSHIFAILLDEPVLQNVFIAVKLETKIIRFAHQSLSVLTSVKHDFLDCIVS